MSERAKAEHKSRPKRQQPEEIEDARHEIQKGESASFKHDIAAFPACHSVELSSFKGQLRSGVVYRSASTPCWARAIAEVTRRLLPRLGW